MQIFVWLSCFSFPSFVSWRRLQKTSSMKPISLYETIDNRRGPVTPGVRATLCINRSLQNVLKIVPCFSTQLLDVFLQDRTGNVHTFINSCTLQLHWHTSIIIWTACHWRVWADTSRHNNKTATFRSLHAATLDSEPPAPPSGTAALLHTHRHQHTDTQTDRTQWLHLPLYAPAQLCMHYMSF